MLKYYLLDVMQQHEHGLYMCELPTGNGKTYDSARAMKEYADLIGDDTKIIYLTTLNSVCSLSNLFFRFHTTTLTEACSNELKQHHL